MKKLMANRDEELYYPAVITYSATDGSQVSVKVRVKARGGYRKEICQVPNVAINFRNANVSEINDLGRLKLVWGCKRDDYHEQLILKEYLVYKMLNLLTDKSFRVRLANVTVRQPSRETNVLSGYAFFIEDVDEMAKRNRCIEIEKKAFLTEQTDREHTTLIALFEYMIGNTDWAVPIYRNVKLICGEKDSSCAPIVVPYDFDYCGLVNAEYAVPVPELGLASVRDRKYLGFRRSMNELQDALAVLRENRSRMEKLIGDFTLLHEKNRTEMLRYIDSFYELTAKEKNVQELFIDHARSR